MCVMVGPVNDEFILSACWLLEMRESIYVEVVLNYKSNEVATIYGAISIHNLV